MKLPTLAQQLIAAVLIASLASPSWGQSQVVGTVVASESAVIRDTAVLPGSTIFSGELVSVNSTGSAQIALPGGGRIEVLHDSSVQLTHEAAGTRFTVQKGGVSFAGGSKDSPKSVFGDATIYPADSTAIGIFHMENADSAVLASIKGTITIATAHDAKSIAVSQGSAVRITLVDPPQAEPAGRAAPSVSKIALIAALAAAAFLAAFLWIAAHEPTETQQQLGSEVSPFSLQ